MRMSPLLRETSGGANEEEGDRQSKIKSGRLLFNQSSLDTTITPNTSAHSPPSMVKPTVNISVMAKPTKNINASSSTQSPAATVKPTTIRSDNSVKLTRNKDSSQLEPLKDSSDGETCNKSSTNRTQLIPSSASTLIPSVSLTSTDTSAKSTAAEIPSMNVEGYSSVTSAQTIAQETTGALASSSMNSSNSGKMDKDTSSATPAKVITQGKMPAERSLSLSASRAEKSKCLSMEIPIVSVSGKISTPLITQAFGHPSWVKLRTLEVYPMTILQHLKDHSGQAGNKASCQSSLDSDEKRNSNAEAPNSSIMTSMLALTPEADKALALIKGDSPNASFALKLSLELSSIAKPISPNALASPKSLALFSAVNPLTSGSSKADKAFTAFPMDKIISFNASAEKQDILPDVPTLLINFTNNNNASMTITDLLSEVSSFRCKNNQSSSALALTNVASGNTALIKAASANTALFNGELPAGLFTNMDNVITLQVIQFDTVQLVRIKVSSQLDYSTWTLNTIKMDSPKGGAALAIDFMICPASSVSAKGYSPPGEINTSGFQIMSRLNRRTSTRQRKGRIKDKFDSNTEEDQKSIARIQLWRHLQRRRLQDFIEIQRILLFMKIDKANFRMPIQRYDYDQRLFIFQSSGPQRQKRRKRYGLANHGLIAIEDPASDSSEEDELSTNNDPEMTLYSNKGQDSDLEMLALRKLAAPNQAQGKEKEGIQATMTNSEDSTSDQEMKAMNLGMKTTDAVFTGEDITAAQP